MHIGGSSAFNRDILDIKFAVVAFCSRLSKVKGFAGNVIFEGVDVIPIGVGNIVDSTAVDGGNVTIAFKLFVCDGIVGQTDEADAEVTDDSDIVLEGTELTFGNSLRLISTKSSYRLWEKESVSFPGKSRKLLAAASGTGGGMDAVNWNKLSALLK